MKGKRYKGENPSPFPFDLSPPAFPNNARYPIVDGHARQLVEIRVPCQQIDVLALDFDRVPHFRVDELSTPPVSQGDDTRSYVARYFGLDGQ